MNDKLKQHKFFGLRGKILIPILVMGLLTLIVSIVCLRYAIYTTGNNLLDMKLTSNLAQITDNGITIDIHYKEGYEGVFSDFTMNINDDSIFNFDWLDSEKKQERQQLGGFFVGGYEYSPEENAFILDDSFRSNEKLIPVIDSNLEGWHSGTKVVDLLLTKGSARFQTTDGDKTYGWLGVCQQNAKNGRPKMLCLGTNGQVVSGLMDYLSIVEGLMMLLITAAIIIIVLYIISRTVRRIRKVGTYLNGVGTGDLPDSLLEINSRDELEEMTNIVNKMIMDLKDKRRIELELNTAANIQLGMLPKDFDTYTNHDYLDLYATMKPAKEVGGDFYDFFMPDDEHLALVIADVSGKGVPAALFMVMGKTLLRSAIQSGKDFSEAISDTNKVLCASNDNALFITVWSALLDIKTGELTFCNAGHNSPLLCRKDGDFSYITNKHGTVLGIFEFAKYKSDKVTLSKGDKLYLYTDGITEAQNSEKELYGEDRLKDCLDINKALSPKETLAAVSADINAFVKDVDQFDDMTMLMIEYKR